MAGQGRKSYLFTALARKHCPSFMEFLANRGTPDALQLLAMIRDHSPNTVNQDKTASPRHTPLFDDTAQGQARRWFHSEIEDYATVQEIFLNLNLVTQFFAAIVPTAPELADAWALNISKRNLYVLHSLVQFEKDKIKGWSSEFQEVSRFLQIIYREISTCPKVLFVRPTKNEFPKAIPMVSSASWSNLRKKAVYPSAAALEDAFYIADSIFHCGHVYFGPGSMAEVPHLRSGMGPLAYVVKVEQLPPARQKRIQLTVGDPMLDDTLEEVISRRIMGGHKPMPDIFYQHFVKPYAHAKQKQFPERDLFSYFGRLSEKNILGHLNRTIDDICFAGLVEYKHANPLKLKDPHHICLHLLLCSMEDIQEGVALLVVWFFLRMYNCEEGPQQPKEFFSQARISAFIDSFKKERPVTEINSFRTLIQRSIRPSGLFVDTRTKTQTDTLNWEVLRIMLRGVFALMLRIPGHLQWDHKFDTRTGTETT